MKSVYHVLSTGFGKNRRRDYIGFLVLFYIEHNLSEINLTNDVRQRYMCIFLK